MFGTFEPERNPVAFGLVNNVNTYNPLKITFMGWIAMLKDMKNSESYRDSLRILFGPPNTKTRGALFKSSYSKIIWTPPIVISLFIKRSFDLAFSIIFLGFKALMINATIPSCLESMSFTKLMFDWSKEILNVLSSSLFYLVQVPTDYTTLSGSVDLRITPEIESTKDLLMCSFQFVPAQSHSSSGIILSKDNMAPPICLG